MVLEALSRWFRSELQQEMLYEDDLVIKTESPKELEERYLAWINSIESKCLKANIDRRQRYNEESTNEGPAGAYGKYLYEVGRKGVGGNSIIPFTVTRCTKNVAVRRDD